MKNYILLFFILLNAVSFAQPPNNLSGLKICIDPGHGGNNAANDRRIEPDPGNVFWESEGNFRKALWLRPLLQQRGSTVFLTRETNDYPTDVDPTLTQRWQFANANNVHWFHSIHSNATGGTNTSTNYTMVLLKENQSSRQPAFPAAVEMSSFIYSNIRVKNRTSTSSGNISGYPGVYKDYTFYGGTSGGFNLGVLNGLIMPGELSEGSFHDYYPETRRLLNNDYRKGEAYGILNGFVEYYKIPYDTLGMIIGSQKNGTTPINNVVVRLLPNNKVYNGDTFNNGFFLFDSLKPGNYQVIYETVGYSQDTVNITLTATGRIVETTIPSNDQTGVARNSSVMFNFIKQMDTSMVRSVFSVNPPTEGTISWNASNTVMTFTPKNLLAFKTSYTMTLSGLGNTPQPTVFVDNKSVTSNVASKPFTVTFQTESLPPFVMLTQPVQNDTDFNVNSNFGIRFSESMDTASVRTAFQIVPSTVGSFTWTSSGLTNNTLLWKPLSGAFAYQTNYTVTISGSAKSIYGMAIDANKDSIPGDAFVMQFRTQSQPASVATNNIAPLEYSLNQNFPNPFNPTTYIEFSVAHEGITTIKVYDLLGREVVSLLNDKISSGKYSIQWDATNVSSGIYFYKLTSEKFTSIKRMVVIK